MTYRNVHTGETMDQDQYLVHQIERYMTELTTDEQAEWQSLYGKAAVKVWSAQNPDTKWMKEDTEDKIASGAVLPTKETLSSPPPRRPAQEQDITKKKNNPPKRQIPSANEKPESSPIKRSSELFGVPPKRNTSGTSLPPTIKTAGSVIPPKRSAKIEDITAVYAPSSTRPPKRSSVTTSAPPRRKINAEPTKQETERPSYTRDELWRMAREDPYYDETPTEDDGVYNRFAKMDFKQVIIVAGLFVVCFVLLFLVVYVVMN